MMETIVIAAIVAFSSMISPLILASLTNKQRREEKIEDYRRQDEVALRLKNAANLQIASNKIVAEAAVSVNNKLDVIHTLVNSNMTSAMQAEYDAVVRELALMNEVISLHRAEGREPSEEALAALDTTKSKIGELKITLDERLKQSEIASIQIKEQGKKSDG